MSASSSIPGLTGQAVAHASGPPLIASRLSRLGLRTQVDGFDYVGGGHSGPLVDCHDVGR
jgi:hypothetical protein